MKILGSMGVVGAILVAAGGIAGAGPTTRFGLTMAATDQAAPGETELGPVVGIGERIGPLTLEVDYAYLSFMDSHTGDGGMQRLGVNVRADVYRAQTERCRRMMACTRGNALYAEGGIAERYGQWHLDAQSASPSSGDRAREAHVGLGIELDNHLIPYRYGWQFAIRFAVSPHDDAMETSVCRGATCTNGIASTPSGGVDKAILLEWAFLIGS